MQRVDYSAEEMAILARVKRIKRDLKRYSLPDDRMQLAHICHLLVTEAKRSFGEFFDPGTDRLPSGKTKATETDAELVERMYETVVEIAAKAQKVHLANSEVKENKDSDIKAASGGIQAKKGKVYTFASTNEYLFFPCKERGPLTYPYFLELIKKIKLLAKDLPDNIRLVLGTFPVVDDEKCVSSFSLQVECGHSPRVGLMSKLTSSDEDLEYPFTRTLFYGGGSSGEPLAREVNKCVKEIIDIIEADEDNETTVNIEQNLQHLIKLINFNVDYKNKGYAATLQKILDRTTGKVLDPDTKNEIVQELRAANNSYIKKVILKSQQLRVESEELIPSLAMMQARHGDKMKCTTPGNVTFHASSSICYDFACQLERATLEREIKSARSSVSRLLPRYVAQMIMSNSTEPEKYPKAFLTSDFIYAHADPVHGGLKKFDYIQGKNIVLQTLDQTPVPSKFANSVNFTVCPLVPISEYRSELLNEIMLHNKFYLEIEALRLYRNKNPLQSEVVTHLIDRKIHIHFLKALIKYIQQNENPELDDLKVELLNQLMAAKKEPLLYRQKVLNFLEQHIKICSEITGAQELIELMQGYRDFFVKDNLALVLRKASQSVPKREEKFTLFQPVLPKHEQLKYWLQENSISEPEFKRALLNGPLIHFCESKLLDSKQFKSIVNNEAFFKSIVVGEIKKDDIVLITNHAAPLLSEPESFAHIFKAIKELGGDSFAKLDKDKKIVMLNLPFKVYEVALKTGQIKMDEYLKLDDKGRSELHDKCFKSYDESSPTWDLS